MPFLQFLRKMKMDQKIVKVLNIKQQVLFVGSFTKKTALDSEFFYIVDFTAHNTLNEMKRIEEARIDMLKNTLASIAGKINALHII